MIPDVRDIEAALRRAADDHGAGLGFSPADVVNRGRRRRRVRVGAAIAGVATASALAVVGIALLPDLPTIGRGHDPAASPTQLQPDPLLARCQQVAGRQVDPKPPTEVIESLATWQVVARSDDTFGTSAVLLPPERDRWALCTYGADLQRRRDAFMIERFVADPPIPEGFVRRDGEWQDGGGPLVQYTLGCPQREDGCDDLYFFADQVNSRVASVEVQTPDGRTYQTEVVDGFVLWRGLVPRDDYPSKGVNALPPIYLTYEDASGEVLSRFNATLLPWVSEHGDCPPGGC